MQYKVSIYLIVLLTICCLFQIGFARLEINSVWEGVWENKTDLMAIEEKDGFIDVRGKDSASIYSCTGIIEGETVECVGSGVNHIEQKRFIYKSLLTFDKKGTIITEKWEAKFSNGKKFSGEATFSKQLKKTEVR